MFIAGYNVLLQSNRIGLRASIRHSHMHDGAVVNQTTLGFICSRRTQASSIKFRGIDCSRGCGHTTVRSKYLLGRHSERSKVAKSLEGLGEIGGKVSVVTNSH